MYEEEKMFCVIWRETEVLTKITKITQSVSQFLNKRTVIYAPNEVKLIELHEDALSFCECSL